MGKGAQEAPQVLPNSSHHRSRTISEHKGLLALDISPAKSAFSLLKSTEENSPGISSSVLIFFQLKAL